MNKIVPIKPASVFLVTVLTLAFGTSSATAQGDTSKTVATRSLSDFETILDRAKDKVFPALVFVKPIVEDFTFGERTKHQVFGSGVIISPDGKVLTNNHVVEKAVRVKCVLHNKEQVAAEILGRDPDTDLALLQLEVPDDALPLPYVSFADSDATSAGDFVMALGSPFGFTRSISLGIISNTQRYLGFETQYRYNTWIQTDAAINPGNSGGPLVNTEGEIVGINTLGIFLADNLGFAIPSNVAKAVAEKLGTHGKFDRAWSGMKLQPLRDFFTDTFTDGDQGVLVADIEEDSPADYAGIQKGDILLSLEDVDMTVIFAEDLPGVEWKLADFPVDTPLKADVLRGGQVLNLEITLAPKGAVEGDTFDCRRWNMTVKEINKHEDPELYFYRKQGVFVLGVLTPGNAYESGLRRKDVITSIGGKPIQTLDEIKSIYETITSDEEREKEILFEVLRGNFKKWVNLDYKKDYNKE